MIDFDITSPTQFEIQSLILQTKNGSIDVSGIFEQLIISDSIFSPCVSGSLILIDAVGINKNSLFDGSEILMMEISKNDDNLKIKKSFRVYKQTDRKMLTQTSEQYTLHFVSEEYILSTQQKINQIFQCTYSEAAAIIVANYLQINSEKASGVFHSSIGLKDIYIPNLSPIDALNWLAKRSIGEDSNPGFLFYENIFGFNFANITELYSQGPISSYHFSPKYLGVEQSEFDFFGIKHFEVIQQYDLINSIKSGLHAAKFIGVDPLTNTYLERPVDFKDYAENSSKLNDSPATPLINNKNGPSFGQYDSKVVVSPFGYFRKESDVFDEEEKTKLNDTENYLIQRPRIFSALLNTRIKSVVSGNFGVSSGLNIHLRAPTYSFKETEQDADQNVDYSLFGKYMIIGTKQIITPQKHETVFEAAKETIITRGKKDVVYSSASNQTFA